MMTRRFALVLLLLVAVLSLASAAFAQSDTITMALSGEPPNLDPHINGGTSARTVRLLAHQRRYVSAYRPSAGLSWAVQLR